MMADNRIPDLASRMARAMAGCVTDEDTFVIRKAAAAAYVAIMGKTCADFENPTIVAGHQLIGVRPIRENLFFGPQRH